MDSLFRRVVFAVLLALCPCAVRAAEFNPGPRPPGVLHDPSGLLDEDMRAEISLPLENMQQEVEVIAVVLTDIGNASPEEAAGAMSDAWCHAPLHAVVLHVPRRADSPWIVTGGDLISSLNPDEVRDEIAAARRDASREPDDVSKIRTAGTAIADLLRYWQGRETTRLGGLNDMRAAIRLELETRARKQQILMLAAAATIVPLIAGVMLARRLSGKSRNSPEKP